ALTVNQSFAYSPSYLYGLFATVAPAVGNFIAPAGDYALNDQRSYASATTARVTETIGTRGLLSFDSGLRYTKFTGRVPGYYDFRAYDVGGSFSYRLNRDMSLRTGYTYGLTEFSPGIRPVQRDIALGIDYQRPLSRTRRTTLGFSAGTTSMSGPLF